MQFDPDNNIIKLCAQGMSLEGEGKKEEALKLFQQAWEEAVNDFEKFTSAHYVAGHHAEEVMNYQCEQRPVESKSND